MMVNVYLSLLEYVLDLHDYAACMCRFAEGVLLVLPVVPPRLTFEEWGLLGTKKSIHPVDQ